MYEFIGVNEKTNDFHLPSEALLLNGVALEDEIKGYRTLTVSGRELMASELVTERKRGSDGSIYIDRSYPPRTITIQYELKTDSREEFRASFNKLNKLLSVEQAKLVFLDDPDYYFVGTMNDIQEVPTGRNTIVSSFSFYCNDPYKYKKPLKLVGKSVEGIFDDTFKTYPQQITVTPSVNVSELTITSADNRIRLVDATFLANQPIVIDFTGDKVSVAGGGINDITVKNISFDSDLENFRLYSEEPVELKESGEIELVFSEVAL